MSVVTLLFKSAKAHPNMRVWFRMLMRLWHGHINRLIHPYRPEIHYMRGPGPRCRAKYRAEPSIDSNTRDRATK